MRACAMCDRRYTLAAFEHVKSHGCQCGATEKDFTPEMRGRYNRNRYYGEAIEL